jgi:hypothetical protein
MNVIIRSTVKSAAMTTYGKMTLITRSIVQRFESRFGTVVHGFTDTWCRWAES